MAVKVDFDGLDQRIVAMPIEPGPYGNLVAGKEGQIFYLRSAAPAGRARQPAQSTTSRSAKRRR